MCSPDMPIVAYRAFPHQARILNGPPLLPSRLLPFLCNGGPGRFFGVKGKSTSRCRFLNASRPCFYAALPRDRSVRISRAPS